MGVEGWRISYISGEFQLNHGVWQCCPVLWPPNGQRSINSASDEQAGQKNQKWGGGPRCMNYAYYITITLQYTARKNNVGKIGLWLRYETISCMAVAYSGHKTALSFVSNSHSGPVWDLYVNISHVKPRRCKQVRDNWKESLLNALPRTYHSGRWEFG